MVTSQSEQEKHNASTLPERTCESCGQSIPLTVKGPGTMPPQVTLRRHWRLVAGVQGYKVTETVNILRPRVSELLREDEAQRLIVDGVLVRVVE